MPSGSNALLSPPVRPTPLHSNSFQKSKTQSTTTRRPRSSSIVSVQEVVDTYDDGLDAGALTNVSTDYSTGSVDGGMMGGPAVVVVSDLLIES